MKLYLVFQDNISANKFHQNNCIPCEHSFHISMAILDAHTCGSVMISRHSAITNEAELKNIDHSFQIHNRTLPPTTIPEDWAFSEWDHLLDRQPEWPAPVPPVCYPCCSCNCCNS